MSGQTNSEINRRTSSGPCPGSTKFGETMEHPAIRVTIEIEDGSGMPFGGSAFANHGVSIQDLLYCCQMAMRGASFSVDELIAVIDGKEVKGE